MQKPINQYFHFFKWKNFRFYLSPSKNKTNIVCKVVLHLSAIRNTDDLSEIIKFKANYLKTIDLPVNSFFHNTIQLMLHFIISILT